jgi:predicted nucleotidyltransferase
VSKLEEELDKNAVCHHFYSIYSEYFTQKALESLGDFKVGGQIISMVRYADDLVLLAKEETILQSMFDELDEVERELWHGN